MDRITRAKEYLKAKDIVIDRERRDSPCESCARYIYESATHDSPAEECCTGVVENMWTAGGCMYYKEGR